MTPFHFVRQIHFQLCAIATVILLQGQSPVLAGESIQDPANGFTLKLPEGFTPHEELASSIPNVIHVYLLGKQGDEQLDVILFIEKLPGLLRRERLRPEHIIQAPNAKLFAANWKGFKLDGVEIPEEAEGIPTLTFNVPIPLKPAAIQLKLFGPANRKADMERLLKEILAGLSGESNWLASTFSGSDISSSNNYGALLLAVGSLIILGGLVILFIVSKRVPKGTVLAIAVGVYAASYQLEGLRIREVVMLKSVLRMLGFAGIILGIIDLRRKSKPQK